ncbi:MAG: glutamate mutase L [Candidatus Bathyarchaeota archaeon]|nr:MAG: glutamate mutase L [Candidatus Bathyarchaeota archaeon]
MDVDNILITDVGSTTSKAILIKKMDGEYRLAYRGEAPTTVERPFEDCRIGVRNAVRQIEEALKVQFLSDQGDIMKEKTMYLSTSSAGGGLQIMVSGVIRRMTAESGERAALGAGAIVLDVMAIDDGREVHEKINRMRYLRPDMILMVGGTDGGDTKDLIESAEIFKSAKPKPRFGIDFKLPLIYAGNKECSNAVKDIIGDEFDLEIVPNIRPTLDVENSEPARNGVHDLFLSHVMSHAPGYPELMKWTDAPILPTPMGEGMVFQLIAETLGVNLIGVGLGGATTNIYSIYDGILVRTVSANLGMSYSICNVMKEAGIANIMRWIPIAIQEEEIRNELRNKMIRPTTIPPTFTSLIVEHAVAREALRLALDSHKSLARPLRGARRTRAIGEVAIDLEETYIEMLNVNLMGTTGGLLSHAPRRAQSALILIDGFQPEGITKIIIDSVFMMPHLGVLSTINPEAAFNVLMKDCMVRAGTCIAPTGQLEDGVDALQVSATLPDGTTLAKTIPYGDIALLSLEKGQTVEMEIKPHRNLDVGMGRGTMVKTSVEGGVVGVIIDARGRPLMLPVDEKERKESLIKWYTAIGAYPEDVWKEKK